MPWWRDKDTASRGVCLSNNPRTVSSFSNNVIGSPIRYAVVASQYPPPSRYRRFVILAEWGFSHNRDVADLTKTSSDGISEISACFPLTHFFGGSHAFFLLLGFLCLDHDSHLLDNPLNNKTRKGALGFTNLYNSCEKQCPFPRHSCGGGIQGLNLTSREEIKNTI
jgi:hypothetical protein